MRQTSEFRIELLGAGHDRGAFSCGVAALDGYFRDQATQDMRRRASACHVAVAEDSGKVAGYYTLADAVMRAVRSEVAIFALAVDTKDNAAESFHVHHGFVTLSSQTCRQVLPLVTFKPKP